MLPFAIAVAASRNVVASRPVAIAARGHEVVAAFFARRAVAAAAFEFVDFAAQLLHFGPQVADQIDELPDVRRLLALPFPGTDLAADGASWKGAAVAVAPPVTLPATVSFRPPVAAVPAVAFATVTAFGSGFALPFGAVRFAGAVAFPADFAFPPFLAAGITFSANVPFAFGANRFAAAVAVSFAFFSPFAIAVPVFAALLPSLALPVTVPFASFSPFSVLVAVIGDGGGNIW